MKVVLTGATGFIGGEILRQCVQNSAISSVIVLSRRQLPSSETANDPKVTTVVVEDFLNYPDSAKKHLRDADACIWSLGIYKIESQEQNRRVNNQYPLTALEFFKSAVVPNLQPGKKFRFLYMSGHFVEQDQQKSLWFMEETRKVRGQGETEIASLSKDNLEIYIARPGAVSRKGVIVSVVSSLGLPGIQIEYLAAAVIDAVLNGSQDQYLSNWKLDAHGKQILDS